MPTITLPTRTAIFLILFQAAVVSQTRVETVAGGWVPSSSAAIDVPIGRSPTITTDAYDNVYIGSSVFNAVFRVERSGIITRLAGTGLRGFQGNLGDPLNADLSGPNTLCVDLSGALLIGESGNNWIRRVDLTAHIIDAYAGTGSASSGGDGRPAASAALMAPFSITCSSSGEVLIAEFWSSRIRRIDKQGIITTVAGSGSSGYNGDQRDAATATLYYPSAVIADQLGNIYVADTFNNRVRRIDARTHTITTVAGNGSPSWDIIEDVPATSVPIASPLGLAMDTDGNLYVSNPSVVLKVNAQGLVSTVAGIAGWGGFSGDGGPANRAFLNYPSNLALTNGGKKLWVVDSENKRIRMVDLVSGSISTVVGNGFNAFYGENNAASLSVMEGPRGLACSTGSDVFVADRGNHRIRRVSHETGMISTLAGDGISIPGDQYRGDGGPARNARLTYPQGVYLDGPNTLYISDTGNHRVRKIDLTTNVISLVAGDGTPGYDGDERVATGSHLNSPNGLASDGKGTLFIADTWNNRIRAVDVKTNIIRTIAGSGSKGDTGDGGLASEATLSAPEGIWYSRSGFLYIADTGNHRIRRVNLATRSITSFAGTGRYGFHGDDGPALDASLAAPTDIVVDGQENAYIADSANNRLRRVDALSGKITTIAGSGSSVPIGDGGPATDAGIISPINLCLDSRGDVYVADFGHSRTRRISAAGPPVAISVIPQSLTLNGSQTVPVSLTSNAPVRFTASVDAGPWLTITPTSGETPATLNIRADAIQVAPGVYSGTVIVRSSAASNSPQSITVALDTFAQRLTVLPPAITIKGADIASKSFSQRLQITGPTQSRIRITTDQSWLQAAADSEFVPSAVVLTVVADKVPALNAIISGKILIEAGGQQFAVVVSLDRTPPSGKLSFATNDLSFMMAQGVRRPGSATVRVINNTDSAQPIVLSTQTSSSLGWLRIIDHPGNIAGSGSAEITVSTQGDLAPGFSDSGVISLLSPDRNAIVSQLKVRVSAAEDLPPDLLYSRDALTFSTLVTAIADVERPVADTINIFNKGHAAVGWKATPSDIYIRIAPTEYYADPGIVSEEPLRVVVERLPEANPSGDKRRSLGRVSIKVSDIEVKSVPATFVVPSGAPPPRFTPTSLLISPTLASEHTRIRVFNQNTETLELTCRSSQPWLTCPGAPLRVPGLPDKQNYLDLLPIIDFAHAPTEVAKGSLTFQVSKGPADILRSAENSIGWEIPVTAIPGNSSFAAATSKAAAISCEPLQLIPVFTSLFDGMIVESGIAQTIEVQLMSNCGDAVADAIVNLCVKGLTNTCSELVRTGVGIWQTSWFPAVLEDTFHLLEVTAVDARRGLKAIAQSRALVRAVKGFPIIERFRPFGSSGDGFEGFAAPGLLYEITGTGLADDFVNADKTKLLTVLGGTSVIVGGRPTVLLQVQPTRLVGLIPFDLTGFGTHRVIIERSGGFQTFRDVQFVSTVPTLLVEEGTQDSVVHPPSTCGVVAPGSATTVYATGLGRVLPTPRSDIVSPVDPRTTASVRLEFDGHRLPIEFAGLVPGELGLYQIRIRIPDDALSGPHSVLLLADGTVSKTATIVVGRCN